MPQRIFRKFSSRRKRRKNDEDVEISGGKPRATKTLSNTSGSKISKITEESDLQKGEQAEERDIKMEVLDALKANETVNNEFENQGYEKSGSSSSQEQNESPKKSLKGTHGNNFELDTISEMPSNSPTEETEGFTLDNKNETNDRTSVHNPVYGTTSLQQEIENELHAPIETGKTRNGSSSVQDELSGENSDC